MNICYMSGYNVCIECGIVQKDLIIGTEAEYIEESVNTKVKLIDVPRKVMIFKAINRYCKLKMSRSLSVQLQELEDLERSSRTIGAAFVIYKKYMDISEVVISSGVAKCVLKKVCDEIQQAFQLRHCGGGEAR